MIDDAVVRAVHHAADTIDGATNDYFAEKWLDSAVEKALAWTFGADRVTKVKSWDGFLLPHWDPRPRAPDVRVLHEDGSLRAVVECKQKHVDQTLWDLFKNLAACQVDGVEANYLIVAARPKQWASDADCVALFNTPPEGVVFEAAWMFEKWAKAWLALLEGGSARPTVVPARVRVRSIAAAPLRLAPSWEIRAITSEAYGVEQLHFNSDGWPVKSLGA